jgi:hypothetical protein
MIYDKIEDFINKKENNSKVKIFIDNENENRKLI